MRRDVAALVAFSLALSSGAAALGDLEKGGRLRVLCVLVEDEPEFFADPPGARPGFDREILEGWARMRKLRVEVVRQTSWDALVPALEPAGRQVLR